MHTEGRPQILSGAVLHLSDSRKTPIHERRDLGRANA